MSPLHLSFSARSVAEISSIILHLGSVQLFLFSMFGCWEKARKSKVFESFDFPFGSELELKYLDVILNFCVLLCIFFLKLDFLATKRSISFFQLLRCRLLWIEAVIESKVLDSCMECRASRSLSRRSCWRGIGGFRLGERWRRRRRREKRSWILAVRRLR